MSISSITCIAASLAFALALAGPARATEVASVDRPAPELDYRLLNGRVLRLKDLRGKVVVKVFWATWSPAARGDLMHLQRLHGELAQRGLEVLALAIDEDPQEVRQFLRTRGYAFPVGMREDVVYDRYGRVSTTPLYYILDRQGVIRHRLAGSQGAAKLEEVLRPLLDETGVVTARP